MKKRLIIEGKDGPLMKSIVIFDEPSIMRPTLNPLSWKILNLLAQKPMYPAEIARFLKIYEQKVYYYIRQLYKIGLLSIEREEPIKGALAKYYK
ncbi:MAG: winged helix-turn-helix domain-containing protein, partial [Nitrososphaerales archaeon]